MNRFVFITLLTVGLICHTSIAHGGGWTQAQGKGYFKLSQQVINAESLYFGDGSTESYTESQRLYDQSLR